MPIAEHAAAPTSPLEHVELPIGGMTCATCAGRIERKLNRLAGVRASVNYATERATVDFDPDLVAGDDLVAAVEAAGYHATLPSLDPDDGRADRHAGADAHLDDLRQRLGVAAGLALPVVALSMVPALQVRGWQWFALVLATPVVAWAAAPFHVAAWRNARHATATMDTLVSIGVLAAYGFSLHALFLGDAGRLGATMGFHLTLERTSRPDDLYLEVAAAVTAFLLGGRYLEALAKRRGGAALEELAALRPDRAARLHDDGREEQVAAAELRVGDRFVVRPGERIATDGVVVEGRAALDTSLLTGESLPRDVGPGDEVVGATVAIGGRLVVRATAVGSGTALARIVRLVHEAQAGKAPVQRLADRVSAVFVPATMALAAATLGFWLGAGWPAASAATAAVAVLIVACPCAMGLAVPTALLVASGRGARLGVLLKGLQVLESTRSVDTVVLDKTGTVTTGDMAVRATTVVEGTDEATVLALAGAVEAASEHPIGRAIAAHLAAATGAEAAPLAVESFEPLAGLGVRGVVDGREVMAGRARMLAERGLVAPPALEQARVAAEAIGATAVLVAVDGEVVALVELADAVKPTSRAAVAELRRMGLHPVLLTGDNGATAQAVAEEVGIDDVVAEVLPADKVAEIRRLQHAGHTVAMVGDGVNDAAALAQADLGVAMGTGTHVAIEASDLTLVRADLWGVVDAIALARRTLAVIKGNLFWAFAYNAAALPIAAAGLLNPMVAGAAMAASSVFVVTNSLRLRRFSSAAP